MRKIITLTTYLFYLTLAIGQQPANREIWKQEVLATEKAFERMTHEKGITEAFYHFADSTAVINRANDSLIYGKANIRHFYEMKNYTNATVDWIPDFIQVSDDGSMAYTYGKYNWKIKQPDGSFKDYRGIFHTVWKKQKDGSWKYVWD